jgi:deoxycytidylate deaminase
MVSDKTLFSMAVSAKENSNCSRRKVGVAIRTKHGNIAAEGYNLSYILCEPCPRTVSGKGLDMCPAIHAEAMAIARCVKRGFKLKDATLYTSDIIPCKDCSNLIVVAGITRIVCRELTFYDELSKDILYTAGIKLEDIEGGYL